MYFRIRKSQVWVVLFVLIITLATATLAQAGGWAVITLDDLPGPQTAGKPFMLGMTVLQHGETPLEIDQLQVTARQESSGQSLTFFAKPDGKPGHYSVELLFPEPGRWEWSVSSGMFPAYQPMPVLEVADASQTAGVTQKPVASALTMPLFPALFVLLALAVGVGMMVISRKRHAPIFIGLGLAVVLCGGLIAAFLMKSNAVNAQVPVTANSASTGQRLFLAKGCVVCHVNDRAIETSHEYGVGMGPNLTAYRNDPDFLRRLLANPQSVDPSRVMPDLHLKTDEIEALAAFLGDQNE